ncbi:putative amino acid transporter [Phaeomoniella chlamydospora]|uniref:Putative amino acid transporter n=1 Tax=Phaeomoniella chlamydospora TaxID=158046 RepID=A0A0G2DSS7_PHACM|nr:putative amino acid transporter [Phaeomoniella chlamydospora]
MATDRPVPGNTAGKDHQGHDVEKDGGDQRRASWHQSLSKGPGYEKGDPFGEDVEGEAGDVRYRTLEWWQAGMIMIAETISLGILSLPSVLASVGMIAGIILIAGLGVIATYSGYVIGQFKIAYPWVHSMADAGEILFQPLGPRAAIIAKEIFGAAQTTFLIFSMASHILTWTICLNTLTDSSTCTIVWGIVGLVVFFIFDIPRTLKKVSWLSIVSFASILSAVLITMVDVGITKPIGNSSPSATTHTAFHSAFLSVSNIVFAYAGHVSFFSFISEFKNPAEFPKALALLQIADTTLYIVVAIVVYRYVGADVDSPALGSASSAVMKKIAYGVAIPTIIIAGVIYGHVASKYIYVRIFRGTKHMSKRTFLATGSWIAIVLTLWVIAWIIAESIPNFNNLLALISSLFASWFTYGITGPLWWNINSGRMWSSPRKIFLSIVNIGMFLLGATICGIGLYASGYAIHAEGGGGSWTCASNAQ